MENYSDISGAKVLVVDDNEYQAYCIRDIFADVNVNADIAHSGQEALDILAGNSEYACVLMDVQMPDMNGYETTGKIRDMGTVSMSRLPIIGIMPGNAAPEDEQAFAAGMNGWIKKPIVPEELYKSLQKCINQTFLGQTGEPEKLKGKTAYLLAYGENDMGVLADILRDFGISVRIFTEFDSVADLVEAEETVDFAFVKWENQTTGASLTTKLKLFCYSTFRHLIAVASDWNEIETKATEMDLDAYILKPFKKYDILNVMLKLLVEDEQNTEENDTDFSGNKILIVDDNVASAMVLQNAVETLGAEADIVNDGKSALELLSTMVPGTYLLVFMDIFMPDMRGIDVASEFRSMSRSDALTLPIIGMSGNSSAKLVEEAIAAGMNALLLKPITRKSLLTYMEIFLNEKLYGGIISDCMKNKISELQAQYRELESDILNERFSSTLLRHAVENTDSQDFIKSIYDELQKVFKNCTCVCMARTQNGRLVPQCSVENGVFANIDRHCENCTVFNIDINEIKEGDVSIANDTLPNGNLAMKVSIPIMLGNTLDSMLVLRFDANHEFSQQDRSQFKILAGIIALFREREKQSQKATANAMETELIMEISPIPMIVANSDGTFMRGNKGLRDRLGLDSNALRQKSREEFMALFQDASGVSPIKELVDGKQNSVSRLTQQGDSFYQEEFTKLQSDDGTLNRIVGTAIDVSELNKTLAREHLQASLLSILILEDNLDIALNKILEQLGRHFNAKGACALKLDATAKTFTALGAYERNGDTAIWKQVKDSFYPGTDTLLKFYAHGNTYIHSSECRYLKDNEFWRGIAKQQNIHKFYGIKILLGDEFWGLFGLYFDRDDFRPTEEERAMLISCSHFVEMVIMRHRNNKQIVAERDKAIEAEKSKSLFFASVSHDIRTPLNSILGFSQLINMGGCSQQEQKEYLDNIIFSGNMLKDLINDVLDLSRLDSGRAEFKNEPNDFPQVGAQVMKTFSFKAAEEKIELKVDIEPMPIIEFDIQRMRQILTNYIGNAVKFTQKGSVTFHGKFTKDNESTGTLEFEIIDTGIGIEESQIEKLAKPFVQLGDAQQHGGTGLGLAICKGMVEQMGGHQWIKSKYGVGSTFGVVIPNVKYHDKEGQQQTQAPAPAETPKQFDVSELDVLLADDIPLNLSVLKAMLKKLNVTKTLLAKDGVEALSILREKHVDVVLTDAWMPNMGGRELAQNIRKDAKLSKLPVFAITADVDFVKEEGNDVFTDILFKPITTEMLEALFQEITKG